MIVLEALLLCGVILLATGLACLISDTIGEHHDNQRIRSEFRRHIRPYLRWHA